MPRGDGRGDNAAFFAGDASKQDAVEGLVDFTIERYGQLDICSSTPAA